MRIFFVTNTYTPYSGGVVQSITALVDELRKQGHEVFIITLTFLDKHNDPEYVIRIPCPIRFMYKKNHMAIAWRPTYNIQSLIERYKPDIIHIHHPFLLGAQHANCGRCADRTTHTTCAADHVEGRRARRDSDRPAWGWHGGVPVTRSLVRRADA